MTKQLLMLTCASSALVLWAGAGHAATAAASDAAASDSTATVGELVVVAEHRETALQKIPVAVSVFTGSQRDLVGISTVEDVTNFAPGFNYDPVTTHAYLRGIGRQSINLTDENRVGTYEDEFYVYSPYNLALSSLFLSQEQIERGPQNVGGRNTEGGSIDMIYVHPTDTPYAEVRASVGNFGAYTFEAAASGPIAPNLTARIAGFYKNQSDGYYTNLAPGFPSEGNVLHEWFIEGQADWKPNDRFELWVHAFTEGWNDRGDAGSRAGYATGSWDETNLTDPNIFLTGGGALFVNPNFGYAAPNGNPTARAAAAGGGDVAQLPISATFLAPGILNNPSNQNPNNFVAPGSRTVHLKNFNDFNYTATYKFDTFEVKYTGGIQGYDYNLSYPYVDTDVSSFTLPGSAGNSTNIGLLNNLLTVAHLGTGAWAGCPAMGPALCTGVTNKGAAVSLPAASTLTVYPNVTAHYGESDWWTAHDISFQSTNDAPFQWLVGAFYFHQHYDEPSSITDPQQTSLLTPYASTPLPILVPALAGVTPSGFVGFSSAALAAPNPQGYVISADYKFDVNSVAGYGQFSYKLNDQWRFTGNLRYSYDSKQGTEASRYIAFNNSIIDGNGTALAALGGYATWFGAATPAIDETLAVTCPSGVVGNCFGTTLAPGVKGYTLPTSANGVVTRQVGGSSGALTGGAGVEWTPTPDIFAYFRYSRGYQSLSFTSGTTAANPMVQPEYLNSYELGYKQNVGHTLSFAVAAFYYDYIGMQLPIESLAADGKTTIGRFYNVPKAESTGIEIEGQWAPVRNLVFTLSYAYDYTALLTGCSGTLTSGVLTPAANSLCLLDTQDPYATAAGANPYPGQNPALPKLQSVRGDPLPQAPRNKVALSAAYTWRFDPGDLSIEGSYAWRDTQQDNVFKRFYNTAPSWDDVDLRLLWKGDHDRYEIIGYVRNVFNSLQYDVPAAGYGLTGNASAIAGTSLFYQNVYELAPPRTFGVEMRYKFF